MKVFINFFKFSYTVYNKFDHSKDSSDIIYLTVNCNLPKVWSVFSDEKLNQLLFRR